MSDSLMGFYGKLPSHGDFVSRRLPRQFIEPWDNWLQAGIAASREQLGKSWLDTFLISPIWQFGLTPGLCGDEAWAGVMMPSVDRVGRYFPLTLAAKVEACQLNALFDPACGWFEALSELAFSSLDYDFDLQRFDEGLQRLSVGTFLAAATNAPAPSLSLSSARLAFHSRMASSQDTRQAFARLGEQLKERFLARCSYWRSMSTESEDAALLVCEGLPPADAYVGFLNGDWPQRGWQLLQVNIPPGQHSTLDSGESGRAMPVSLQASTANPAVAVPVTPSSFANPKAWESHGLSVVGLRRKLNEDAILLNNEGGLWAVADGMGGHSAGDVASQALVDALAAIPPIDDLEHLSEQVASLLHNVNRQLVQMASGRGYGHIIGSTIVVLLVRGREFRYLWAGDSRLYRYRQGKLEQLTLDHSLYNESISQGGIPVDGSLDQGRGNVITRAVGADNQLQLDFGQGIFEKGDLFLLCSDGIDKELSHADIAGLCDGGSVKEIAERLVQAAESRGGRDNISAIVVRT